MDDLAWLVVLAAVMFAASFLAGIAPLAISMSEQRMNVLAPYGAGILVGTALVVILPEGVATLYSSSAEHDGHEHGAHHDGSALASSVSDSAAAATATAAAHAHSDVSAYVGPALLLGFLVMFLIDYFGPDHTSHGHDHSHAHAHSHAHSHGLPNAGSVARDEEAVGAEGAKAAGPAPTVSSGTGTLLSPPLPILSSSFVGLLVHNVADGIAMGAASAGTNKSLETIVFLAIIMHKAPAAFGLCTLLLHEGRTRSTIRQMLAIFSSVPPISSVVTYLILSSVDVAMPKNVWTGLVLLFSAGSFLYVAAVHVLPDVMHDPASSINDAYALGPPTTGPFGLRPTQVRGVSIVLGMLTPLLLTGHGHGH